MGTTCCKHSKTKRNESPAENKQNRRNDQTSGQNRRNGQNGHDNQTLRKCQRGQLRRNGQTGQNGHMNVRGQFGKSTRNGTSHFDYNQPDDRDSHSQHSSAMIESRNVNNPGTGRNGELKYTVTISPDNGLIINCYDENLRSKDQPINNRNGTESRREIFKCSYPPNYSAGSRRCLVPAGNFIDSRNNHNRKFMYDVNELSSWSHSICQLRYPNGTATGFRVGSSYIMTALHVVQKIHQQIGASEQCIGGLLYVEALKHPNVFCLFDYFKEIQFTDVKKYFLKPVVHFFDDKTDTAVLELRDNRVDNPLPPPFELLNAQYTVTDFTLIGHNGAAMVYNEVDQVVDRDSETTCNDIQWIKDYSLETTGFNYELLPHNVVLNDQRILFHCKLNHGASGSPGIVVLDDRVVVVTMLLCGYPDWYYSPDVDQRTRTDWPEQYCIEQGVDMFSVSKTMSSRRPDLYRDIFCWHIPNPVLYGQVC